MNLILTKYFTLYIIYKKLFATPRKKQNNPLGDCDPQVENHWLKPLIELITKFGARIRPKIFLFFLTTEVACGVVLSNGMQVQRVGVQSENFLNCFGIFYFMGKEFCFSRNGKATENHT